MHAFVCKRLFLLLTRDRYFPAGAVADATVYRWFVLLHETNPWLICRFIPLAIEPMFTCLIFSVYTVRFDVNNPDNNLYQQMSHLIPPTSNSNVDGTVHNITQYHQRNLNDWNFAEHFEPDVFVQVSAGPTKEEQIGSWWFTCSDRRTSLVHSFSCRCLLQSTRQYSHDGSLIASTGRQNGRTREHQQETLL